MRSLLRALIMEGRVETTEAKAKALRPAVEKLVTKSKTDSMAARRLINARVGNQKDTMEKLVSELGPKYKDREGGYTRITKLPARQGDASPMAVIEFV